MGDTLGMPVSVEPSVQVTMTWCEPHQENLRAELFTRGLTDAFDPNLGIDAHFEATFLVTHAAIQMFTPQVVVAENEGCPVCAFQRLVPHIADQLLRKYKDPA